MQNRRGGDGEWGNGAIVAVVAAMVLVMAVITFTLHKNSPLVANGPSRPPLQKKRGREPLRPHATKGAIITGE